MKKWLVVVLGTSLFSVCLAQTKSPSTAAAAKQNQKKEAAYVKFSMDMLAGDRIDLAYKAIPAPKVVDAIEKMPIKGKGEFESTADFNARLEAALGMQILGGSILADPFAFAVSVPKLDTYENISYKFNADTGEVSLFALPKIDLLGGAGAPEPLRYPFEVKKFDQFALGQVSESSSMYKGRNAFGTTTGVLKKRSTSVGIAANPVPFLKFERKHLYFNPTPIAKFKLDNAKAAKELPALKALLVMKLAPYLRYDQTSEAPTISSPVDEMVQHKYLAGDLIGIVYYSGITGEIVARVPENFGLPAPQPVAAAASKSEAR